MESLTSKQIIDKINNKESFVLKLFASWCGPCKVLTEEFKKTNLNVPTYEYDVESDVEFSGKLGIRSVPVLKFYKNGEVTHTSVGLKSGTQIQSMVNEYVV